MLDVRKRRRLLLIALNELNFDTAAAYVRAGHRLPAFARLLAAGGVRTMSETRYEDLEPWIQWPSVYNGLAASGHGIFRLGDVVGSSIPQVFERLEQAGFKVGCISPMNAENRLRRPAYFIPDPWTATRPDDSWWSRALSQAVAQAVNDNSEGRVKPRSLLYLLMGLMRFARVKHYGLYARLAAGSPKAPWRKALFLDLLLHDLHLGLMRARAPHFSTVFLNAGAHIQHHYFFNSMPARSEGPRNPAWYVPADRDPVAEMLSVYDRIISEYLTVPGVDVIFATGLTQCLYDRVKYYYRLRDHAGFLRQIGLAFKAVHPRMTRDLLVEFDTAEQAAAAEGVLRGIVAGDKSLPLFGEVENRGCSLFLTLTYPEEITPDTDCEVSGRKLALHPHVVFVAIKNGMHSAEGFAYFSPGVVPFAPAPGAHVRGLHETICRYFGVPAGEAGGAPAAVHPG